MQKKKYSPLWPPVRWLVKVFYGKHSVEGAEHLPPKPCILVANHAQMHGPIVCELHLPLKRLTWCAGEMMHAKEVPEYAFCDFWSYKPKGTHWFYKILAYLITPLSVLIFNNAETIPVYHDSRAILAFKRTLQALEEGTSVVVFPEQDVPHNNIVFDFQDKFIDLARLYHKRTGEVLSFVPMYIAPALKKTVIGKPVAFDPAADMDPERQRIKEQLMQDITDLAVSLPRHRVVPYRNVAKKCYPMSKEGN